MGAAEPARDVYAEMFRKALFESVDCSQPDPSPPFHLTGLATTRPCSRHVLSAPPFPVMFSPMGGIRCYSRSQAPLGRSATHSTPACRHAQPCSPILSPVRMPQAISATYPHHHSQHTRARLVRRLSGAAIAPPLIAPCALAMRLAKRRSWQSLTEQSAQSQFAQ